MPFIVLEKAKKKKKETHPNIKQNWFELIGDFNEHKEKLGCNQRHV
jgi:hypothetical protein